MGTTITLYHHADAQRVVQELNDAERQPPGPDPVPYPAGIREVEFQSKKHNDVYPLVPKVHRLNAFLAGRELPTLDQIFGYSSAEPEDMYLIPNWGESLRSIRKVLGLFPGIPNTGMDIQDHKVRLEALEEMILWVINQEDRGCYFLYWSA